MEQAGCGQRTEKLVRSSQLIFLLLKRRSDLERQRPDSVLSVTSKNNLPGSRSLLQSFPALTQLPQIRILSKPRLEVGCV